MELGSSINQKILKSNISKLNAKANEQTSMPVGCLEGAGGGGVNKKEQPETQHHQDVKSEILESKEITQTDKNIKLIKM